MKQFFLFSIIVLFSVTSCTKKSGFTISGKLENGADKTIYLDELTTTGIEPSDSAKIGTDGSFEISGITSEPKFFILRFTMNNFITLIVDSLSEIEVTGDANNLLSTYNVAGSNDSKLVMEIDKKVNTSIAKVDSLTKTFHESQNSPDADTIKAQLDAEYQRILEENRRFNLDFINKNKNSLASLKALYQKIGNNSLINPYSDYQFFNQVDSAIGLTYPNSKHSKALHANLLEVRKAVEAENANKQNINSGSEAPEISLPNPDGKTINLSDFRGKIVLLDFWASWCKPCRAENPNLVANYKKYSKKGFEIFQVSLDKTKQEWVNAISKDNLIWIHVSDLQYWNSPAAKLYNVSSIPANFLIDKDGKIIASNLRGEELGNKLKEIFKY
ncbi:MAG: hypothetical protein A2033_04865 [Bacteroidetes bacterium GWA2_31_9]|nr:MAG: hypothetical protein A2033_04865 [Bacteroidetes bacterium GWA2_31_9]